MDPVTASLIVTTVGKGVGELIANSAKRRNAITPAQIEAKFLTDVRRLMESGTTEQINQLIGELNKLKGGNLQLAAQSRLQELLNDLDKAKSASMKNNTGDSVAASAAAIKGAGQAPRSILVNSGNGEPPKGFFAKLWALPWYWLVAIAIGLVLLYKLLAYLMKKGKKTPYRRGR